MSNLEGKVAVDDFSGGYRMTVNKVMSLAEAKTHFATGVRISVQGPHDSLAESLASCFAPYRNGSGPVYVEYRNQRARARLSLSDEWRLKPCEELVAALNELPEVSEARLTY